MITRVTTESGSVYEIDQDRKTWARITDGKFSGRLRTKSGTYDAVSPLVIGQGLLLHCPPLRDNGPQRMIYTSNIVSTETL